MIKDKIYSNDVQIYKTAYTNILSPDIYKHFKYYMVQTVQRMKIDELLNRPEIVEILTEKDKKIIQELQDKNIDYIEY